MSKILISEHWHDYVEPKYVEKAKLRDKDSFIVRVKNNVTYEYIAEDVETNYVLERSLLKRKIKKVICVMKDEIDENINKEFAELRTNTYS